MSDVKMCPFGESVAASITRTLQGDANIQGGGHMTPCIENKCALWVPYSNSGACAYYLQGQAAVLSLEALAKIANPAISRTFDDVPAGQFECSQCGELCLDATKARGTDMCKPCEEEVGRKDLDDSD